MKNTANTSMEKSFTSNLRFVGHEKVNVIMDWREITYRDVARSVGGYQSQYLSMILRGKYVPPLRLRVKIADFFNLPIETLWR